MNTNIFNILKNIKFSSIISTTNKTLNVIKKSIPVYREIKPYATREKSLFKKKETVATDEIKESMLVESNDRTTINDSLTFFQ